MPERANVLIRYGPYETCSALRYRTARLDGLKHILRIDGHSMTLEKIKDWNAVEIWVKGELVFKCDIRDFDFGGDGELDQLSQQARIKVKNAF